MGINVILTLVNFKPLIVCSKPKIDEFNIKNQKYIVTCLCQTIFYEFC